MLIPVLYLSLSIRDPNHVDDNVYNNHKHPAYAYRKFWLFQEPNRHSPNFFRTACNNHPMNYWTYYILHINAFDNLIAPLRHIFKNATLFNFKQPTYLQKYRNKK